MKTQGSRFALWLLAASALGGIVGYIVGEPINVIKPLGDLFYRLLFMIVPILVFFSLCSSFAQVGDIRQLSKWAGKIVGWFVITTLIGSVIGIIVGLIWRPGAGLVIKGLTETPKVAEFSAATFLEWIPQNGIGAIAEGNIIQIVIFAIIIGIAVSLLPEGKHKQILQDLIVAGTDLFITVAGCVLYYAPIGVFALMATSVAAFRGALLVEMANFLTAYTAGYIFHVVFVYGLLFWVMTRLNPLQLFRKALPALLTAFTTCSSAATLPVTLRCTEDMGVPDELKNFGIPLGMTFNMDSMAIEIPLYIMLGMFAINMQPTIAELIQFLFLGLAFSIGCAGVPGGGIAIAVILVKTFNLPEDVVAWIAAVFAYLDITGTPMNVWGDMVCTTIVAKREGLLDMEKFNS